MEEFVYFYGTYITREQYDKWYEEHYEKEEEHDIKRKGTVFRIFGAE